MTTETSNARGEWVLVPREPTPEMVQASDDISCRAEGAEHWAAMLAAAPPPAAARGDVRGVVDALQRAAESVHVPPKMTETRGEYFKAGARAMLTAMNRELAALTGERNG